MTHPGTPGAPDARAIRKPRVSASILFKVSPLQFEDYRQFLRTLVDQNPGRRGLRTDLARAASCSPSFLTQVLSDEAALSFDHIIGIASFLELEGSELAYLRELVIKEKCATRVARLDSEARAAAIRSDVGDGLLVGHPARPNNARAITEVMTTLPHWDVFGLLGAPGDSSPDRIALRLKLTVDHVRKILDDLATAGIVKPEREGDPDGPWTCLGEQFKLSRGLAVMGSILHKMRVVGKVIDGQIDPSRYVSIRLKASDVDELRQRANELFEFAWSKAREREETGDTLVYMSVDVDRIC